MQTHTQPCEERGLAEPRATRTAMNSAAGTLWGGPSWVRCSETNDADRRADQPAARRLCAPHFGDFPPMPRPQRGEVRPNKMADGTPPPLPTSPAAPRDPHPHRPLVRARLHRAARHSGPRAVARGSAARRPRKGLFGNGKPNRDSAENRDIVACFGRRIVRAKFLRENRDSRGNRCSANPRDHFPFPSHRYAA